MMLLMRKYVGLALTMEGRLLIFVALRELMVANSHRKSVPKTKSKMAKSAVLVSR